MRFLATTLLLAALVAGSTGCAARADVDDYRAFAAEAARRGLWREAELRWRQALELQPGDAELLNNLAVAAEALGDYSEARRLYRRAMDLEPGNETIRDNLLAFSDAHPGLVDDGEDEPAADTGGETDGD